MSDDKPIYVHIARSEFTPPEPNGCPHRNTEFGYGLAGGGMGAYIYCTDCNQVIEKTLDHDD